MSNFQRTFNNIFGGEHPALSQPAGLSSGQLKRAADRGAPCTDAKDYLPPRKTVWQTPLPIPDTLSLNITSADIKGSGPTNRPLPATSFLPNTFKVGTRVVNPLEPRYVLPSSMSLRESAECNNTRDLNDRYEEKDTRSSVQLPHFHRANNLEVRDINGGALRSSLVPPAHRPHQNLDISDIPGATKSPTRRQRDLACLTTADIKGATVSSRHHGITSGPFKHGTLKSQDILGAFPGDPLMLGKSVMLGRWPPPSSPKYHFSRTPRRTTLKRLDDL
mmetsp:Transcript_8752/g.16593  ORF Transcript_8752/g.16593 Transcript_8752/m.16593 type:complete len:276 (-) Transcript_8752:350-1177(-)